MNRNTKLFNILPSPKNFFCLVYCLILLSGCLFAKRINFKTKGDFRLIQEDFSNLSGWEEDDHKLALQAFLHSCRKFAKMPQSRQIGRQMIDLTPGDFRDVCDIAEVVKNMSAKQARNFFENWFRIFAVVSNKNGTNGTFTGYYEASLEGSMQKTGKFIYPIYGKPKNFETFGDLTREQIEAGELKNSAPILLYTDNKVDLFFMQIQGSGRINLKDGRQVRLTFSARNRQPFIAISNQMYERGLLKKSEMNSAGVLQWLKSNPEKADEIMNLNPAYTFFEIFRGDYVVGSQGVPLTPEKSLAVDSDLLPLGLPFWLETSLKNSEGKKERFEHLMIAQDTGSAIKGTVRGDIFFGYGKEAEDKAFYAAAQGKYFVLLPISVVDRIAGN